MNENLNIVVVDDHPIVRKGLYDILIKFPFIKDVKLVDGGKKFLELMKNHTAHLVILDIRMPDIDGVDLAKIIKEKYSDTAIMIFSSHLSEQYINQCYEIGVDAYVSKDANTGEIKTAIQKIIQGETYFSADVEKILLKKLMQKGKNKDKFSDREKDILKYICEGKANKKIAEILFISENTVNNHRANIMKKANCHNVRELYEFALQNKLIEMPLKG